MLHIQTIPLDDRNSIGVIDLRTCLQAVAQCSPEIINQLDYDYTVYASDYSEPDVPLVGQGMLSWGLDPNSDPQSQQLVTGRVTRNLMALFGKGNSDTLEVRLKLTAVPKMHHRAEGPGSHSQPQHQHSRSFQSQHDTAHSEWNSLIQSNPGLGQSVNVSRFPSPSIPPARMENSGPDQRYASPRPDGFSIQQMRPPSAAPAPMPTPADDSLPQLPPLPQQRSQPSQPAQLTPAPTSDVVGPEKPARPSRPSSRASRSKGPTGRPRGRPRKKPLDAGHTSGAEMTDADDGPQRKRAKVTTQVDYNTTAPFSSHPDSLRVAASTSGSLRNMRPVGAGGGIPAGNHLQEVPRAPTPVPNASQQQMRPQAGLSRKGSMSGFDMYQMQSNQPSLQTSMSMSMTQDARSPTDSIAQSPDQIYTPDQSPPDLGSSPPVPRTSAYPRSSPAPSSPTLPPVDSGFMSGGMEDFFEEDDLAHDLPRQDGLPDMLPKLPLQKPAPQRTNRQEAFSDTGFTQPQIFPFQEVHPGPQELLPQTSLFRPHGKAKALNRMQAAAFEPKGPPAPVTLAPTRRQLQFQRSNTAPLPPRIEPRPAPEISPVSRAAFEVPLESVEGTDNPTPAAQVKQPLEQSGQPPVQPQMSEDLSSCMKRRPSQPESNHGPRTAPPMEQSRRNTEPPVGEVAAAEPSITQAQPTEPHVAETPITEPELPTLGPGQQVQALSVPPTGAKPASAPSSVPASQTLQAQSALLPPMRPASPRTKSLPAPPVPASDPVGPTFLTLPQLPEVPQSEGPCPPAENGEQGEQPKYNKNLVKKQSIKDRLETAIANGEMPPFCNNCGAIETPTWRKIWTQEHRGVPGFHEFSDKPGCVTCIDILERAPTGQPTLYRLVKKNLGGDDLRVNWKELLLCNRKSGMAYIPGYYANRSQHVVYGWPNTRVIVRLTGGTKMLSD